MTPKIKICGITNREDARLAAELGADMLGFIFYAKSPRAVRREVMPGMPAGVERVGVFVNESEAEIRRTVQECRLTMVQLHGEESPEFCRRMPVKVVKAVRVKDEKSLQAAAEYDVDALLLDTYTAGQHGGTGQVFDWSLAVKAKTILKVPVILSGGLTPENVAEAIRVVQPYAVDVASGVEREPGKKDPDKLRRFFEACKKN